MSDEVKDGDKIVYAAADAGRILDEQSIVLIPDEILTVGEDLTAPFAQRLVDDHVCKIVEVAGDEASDKTSDDGTSPIKEADNLVKQAAAPIMPAPKADPANSTSIAAANSTGIADANPLDLEDGPSPDLGDGTSAPEKAGDEKAENVAATDAEASNAGTGSENGSEAGTNGSEAETEAAPHEIQP